jgi:hypothetical protein
VRLRQANPIPVNVLPSSNSVAGSGVGAMSTLLLKSLIKPPTPTSMSLCRNMKSTGLAKNAFRVYPVPAVSAASRSAGAQVPVGENITRHATSPITTGPMMASFMRSIPVSLIPAGAVTA